MNTVTLSSNGWLHSPTSLVGSLDAPTYVSECKNIIIVQRNKRDSNKLAHSIIIVVGRVQGIYVTEFRDLIL